MGLDFSKLTKIASYQPDQQEREEDLSLDSRVEANLTHEKKAYKRMLDVNKKYEENKRKSTLLQGDIYRGIASGESYESLFYKATDIIGYMTGNDKFTTMLKSKRDNTPD
ncbi:hypothetical protein ACWOEZ_06720 [Aerococcus suis]